MNFKCRTACKCHLNINDSVIIKYKIIYDFVLTLMKKEWIFNAFKKSAKKTFNLNKLIFITCNNKGSILLLNEPHKVSVVKWKVKNMLMNKLVKQIKVLTLTLKITLTVSISASLYSSVAVPQPAVVYTSQMNFSALAAAAAAAENLKSVVAALGSNQCAFCWLEGHWKLWNKELSCPLLIIFIQTKKMHLNVNKWII